MFSGGAILFIFSFVAKAVFALVAKRMDNNKVQNINNLPFAKYEIYIKETAKHEEKMAAMRLAHMGAFWLACGVYLCLIGGRIVIPVFWPEVDITYVYSEVSKWLIFTGSEKIKLLSIKGIVILPIDVYILSIIGGSYFGGQGVK